MVLPSSFYIRSWLAALGLLATLAIPALAADEPAPAEADPDAIVAQVEKSQLSAKGADSCLKCHDEENEYPVFPIFKTKHAQSADPRAPFADLQCEACHGPGQEHSQQKLKGKEGEQALIFGFGSKSWTPVEVQNGKCLECHQNHDRVGWQGSAHETNGVACADCHKLHVSDDPALRHNTQSNVCYNCHQKERAEFYQAFAHPVRFGKMGCTECHAVHGGAKADLADKANVNQICTSCHAEKRGPFLWEHAPVSEDCTVCHQPHGSNNVALLTKRSPLLCQDCHSQADHPSTEYDGSSIRGSSVSRYVALKACGNCHSQVHGSNHPSGVLLTR